MDGTDDVAVTLSEESWLDRPLVPSRWVVDNDEISHSPSAYPQ